MKVACSPRNQDREALFSSVGLFFVHFVAFVVNIKETPLEGSLMVGARLTNNGATHRDRQGAMA